MTLHPIAVVDAVLDEYRSYLRTEFRASDEKLRAALEAALDEPGFLAQEPFFQAHRPFKDGAAWSALGLDAALAKTMAARAGSPLAYLHQSDAIAHLLAPDATPLVVTTGTGSGKTECFLLPVIQNAIEDAVRFKRSGLTALLVYPMNALANDQEERIRQYLEASGHTHVQVARYDRTTQQEQRERLRRNPPHLLLTNYMMLEYLLVRPADRDAIFANHRCRFAVLDEVHTYRGSLGTNIALLFRRLRAHLAHATQDWSADDRSDVRRFPSLVPVATSATIKSIDEAGRSAEEVRALRDTAVREFFSKLSGADAASIRVIGEQIRDLEVPREARWSRAPAKATSVATLAGLPESTDSETAARSAAILWKLGDLLARRPLSVSGIVERIRAEVPARRDADPAALRGEVESALALGASLPDDTPGALRLRTHRFVRGGWRFHRCVDPGCGRLFPMGEEKCACGKRTAPLLLCRSCGAHALHFRSETPDAPESSALVPGGGDAKSECVLYVQGDPDDDEDELVGTDKQMKARPIVAGSFDPDTCSFGPDEGLYPLRVVLAPARNRCLVCGAWAGSGSILTPVALGTSAAVRVLCEALVESLAEQNRDKAGHDGKERLLVFADSRQDAAHQARFITYAGRYDRMRRRLVEVVERAGGPVTLDDAVRGLVALGVARHDNPSAAGYDDAKYLPTAVQSKARAWEEAPLLDDLSVSAGYRSTIFNLGLVGVRYDCLDEYVRNDGAALAAKLGISPDQLLHVARCLLDEMRRRGALSREMLAYHPQNPSCPEEFRANADWERRAKSPNGYACTRDGRPLGHLDESEVPDGIRRHNFWRGSRSGRSPSVQRKFEDLLRRMGGADATEDLLIELLEFLCKGPRLLKPSPLHGYRDSYSLLQVNADCVQLALPGAAERQRCTICNVRTAWAVEGAPCPTCHGTLRHWPEEEVLANRFARRILKRDLLPLHGGEHTAQITGDARIVLEENFKAPPSRSPLNVLACSPTLEMGIDVGGLDAVVMRNIPPRPDNYAQRGGRAGRRSRVGIVIGYARSTPHDAYFYDKPAEMIAGEVPAPAVGLGNRDVVLRHLHAIAFGAAEPGLAGKMADYVTLKGEVQTDAVAVLKNALAERSADAAALAREAWGPEILEPSGLAAPGALEAALAELPARIDDLVDRVRHQIIQLEETIKRWSELGRGDRGAVHAMDLKRRLLGIRSERDTGSDADDRSSGHPMRRFAEFGILPGYEFPSEPSTLRLWGDEHEEEAVTVERRFGIAQYQPEAKVHARGHRWQVIGLDLASPWNPKSPEPSWLYSFCKRCTLRYGAQEHVRCPRCGCDETHGNGLPGHEFGGFTARRDDSLVLEEEDRFAISALVQCHPQWNGIVQARYATTGGHAVELRRAEDVRWLNEWKPPSPADKQLERPKLHDDARGFYLCPSCGKVLSIPEDEGKAKAAKGRRRAARSKDDRYGHAAGCADQGKPPRPRAITSRSLATTLRLVVNLPFDHDEKAYQQWGLSLGYAMRIGMRQLYMLDGPEVEFVLEPMWAIEQDGRHARRGALTFVDAAVGGSGFLDRAAAELHLVAARTIEHLDHPGCETACYRCLKSYNNQRHHELLSWPLVMPDLEALAADPPERLAPEIGDAADPRPWLDAFDAGVGSPLELSFLHLFEEHGLVVEKQVPVAPNVGDAPISIADFVVSGAPLAIYVDGASFHRGERLRRDRAIREKLRSGSRGWKVMELRARDLARGRQIVDAIRAAATG